MMRAISTATNTTSRMRPALYDFFLERGVLLRPLGNVVYVLPPYVITDEELYRVYDVLTESLELVGTAAQRSG